MNNARPRRRRDAARRAGRLAHAGEVKSVWTLGAVEDSYKNGCKVGSFQMAPGVRASAIRVRTTCPDDLAAHQRRNFVGQPGCTLLVF